MAAIEPYVEKLIDYSQGFRTQVCDFFLIGSDATNRYFVFLLVNEMSSDKLDYLKGRLKSTQAMVKVSLFSFGFLAVCLPMFTPPLHSSSKPTANRKRNETARPQFLRKQRKKGLGGARRQKVRKV